MDFNDFVKQLNSAIASDDKKDTTPKENNVPNENKITLTEFTSPTFPTSETSTGKTVKIMIVSTHVNQTNGYSKVAFNVINQLSSLSWVKVVHYATQKIQGGEVGRKYPDNVKVIDATALEKQKGLGFALAELPGVINSEKPDVVFIYNDMSVICAYIEEIRKVIQNRFFKIWAYIDMTYKGQPQGMVDVINRDVERIFCFTKTWKDEIKSQGITRPVDVLNHGVDSKALRQIPKDLARRTLGLPSDIFMFTSLNKNIPRKRLDLLIISFVKFIVRFPMKPIFMLVVADKGDKGGYQLFDIFARELKKNGAPIEQFGNRLLITHNAAYSDQDVNLLYNSGDVGISCAEGEGFGLCTFEQMYCGVPQIVPNINGYSEYCTEENSILIAPKITYYIPQGYNSVTGEAQMVDTEDVAKAMERYYFDEDLRKLHGKLGRETVEKYTWEKCCTTLIKRLKMVQEEDD